MNVPWDTKLKSQGSVLNEKTHATMSRELLKTKVVHVTSFIFYKCILYYILTLNFVSLTLKH